MLTRVRRTAAATLAHTFYGEGDDSEAGATLADEVTVTVVDAAGTAVTDGTATPDASTPGRVTFALPGQPALAELTVTWTAAIDGGPVSEQDTVEVVGGFFFTLAAGRNSDKVLADKAKYTTADLIRARLETEQECEEICDRAFVPRYGHAVRDGSGVGELAMPANDLRIIRSVRTRDRYNGPWTVLTAEQLALLVPTEDALLVRSDGQLWPAGRDNVVVEYEYGLTQPPDDLRRAAMRRFRWFLGIGRGTIPDRATSFTATDGSTYRLDMPGPYKTGLPDVDAAYGRWSLRSTGDAADGGRQVPASRTLNYDPQRDSLFHGGIR